VCTVVEVRFPAAHLGDLLHEIDQAVVEASMKG